MCVCERETETLDCCCSVALVGRQQQQECVAR